MTSRARPDEPEQIPPTPVTDPDEPLPPAASTTASAVGASAAREVRPFAGTLSSSRTDPGPGGGGTATKGNAFAADFARHHFFSGLHLLKPGRRAMVAAAGVVSVAVIAVGGTAVLSHVGNDHVDARPAATDRPLITKTRTPSPVKSPTVRAAPNGGKHAPAKGTPATTVPQAPPPPTAMYQLPPSPPPAGAPLTSHQGSSGNSGSSAPSAPSAPKPTSNPVTFTGGLIVNFASDRCLASQGGSRSAGTQMVIADCNQNDPSQGWTFPSDGTARDFGGTRCLDVSDEYDGVKVKLAACSASRSVQQGFVLKPSYDLVDRHDPDLCMDATDNGTAAGTVLQLWPCGGTSNQKWRMP
jgi:hypothetical protein